MDRPAEQPFGLARLFVWWRQLRVDTASAGGPGEPHIPLDETPADALREAGRDCGRDAEAHPDADTDRQAEGEVSARCVISTW
ncbi:MAG: hypothetical protein B7Z45_10190 [Azorhizobium sp. 12-66-6]|nr:MAG: hypothetical protein B7Z45_10190 [Azorhizobium sp. 12-66-6]